jgi:hypothetical protein
MERLRYSQLHLMMAFLDTECKSTWRVMLSASKSLLGYDHVTIYGKYDPLGHCSHELSSQMLGLWGNHIYRRDRRRLLLGSQVCSVISKRHDHSWELTARAASPSKV